MLLILCMRALLSLLPSHSYLGLKEEKRCKPCCDAGKRKGFQAWLPRPAVGGKGPALHQAHVLLQGTGASMHHVVLPAHGLRIVQGMI